MEETEGKLNELGQRISAIEKAQLQSLELIQGEPLTKDKIEELKKSREEQVQFVHFKASKPTVFSVFEMAIALQTNPHLAEH